MANPYVFSYKGAFELPLEPPEAWDRLEQSDLYQSWWPWMRHLEVEGTPLEPGSTYSFLVVAPIPFTMRLRVEVERAEEPDSISALVAGDLQGTATMGFEYQSPGRCVAHISWTIEVVKAGVRPIVRLTRPLLLWGQTWAVDVALRGFRRHLDDA